MRITREQLDEYETLYRKHSEELISQDKLDAGLQRLDDLLAEEQITQTQYTQRRQAWLNRNIAIANKRDMITGGKRRQILRENVKHLLREFSNTYYTLNTIIAVMAATNQGKSLFVLNAIRQCVEAGGRCVVILFESSPEDMSYDVMQFLSSTGLPPDLVDARLNSGLLVVNGNDPAFRITWENFCDRIEEMGWTDPTQYDFIVVDNLDNLIVNDCGIERKDKNTLVCERMNNVIMPRLNAMYAAGSGTFRTPLLLLKQLQQSRDPFSQAQTWQMDMQNAKMFGMSLTDAIYTAKLPYVENPTIKGNMIYRAKYRTVTSSQTYIETMQFAKIDHCSGTLDKPILQPEDPNCFQKPQKKNANVAVSQVASAMGVK